MSETEDFLTITKLWVENSKRKKNPDCAITPHGIIVSYLRSACPDFLLDNPCCRIYLGIFQCLRALNKQETDKNILYSSVHKMSLVPTMLQMEVPLVL